MLSKKVRWALVAGLAVMATVLAIAQVLPDGMFRTIMTTSWAVIGGDTLDVGDTASGSDVNRINIHGRAGANPTLRRGGAQTWRSGNVSAGDAIVCEQFVNSAAQMVFSDAQQSAFDDSGNLAIGCASGDVTVGGEFTVTSGSVDFERTDALSGVMLRRNNTSAPSAGEDVAVLVGSGENDAGTTDVPYGTVTISSVDVTAGSETGRVTLDAKGGAAGELVVDADLVTVNAPLAGVSFQTFDCRQSSQTIDEYWDWPHMGSAMSATSGYEAPLAGDVLTITGAVNVSPFSSAGTFRVYVRDDGGNTLSADVSVAASGVHTFQASASVGTHSFASGSKLSCYGDVVSGSYTIATGWASFGVQYQE